MAGGWSLGQGAANLKNYGSVSGSSALTSLTTGATNTKGSYVQLVASTTSDSSGLLVMVSAPAATGTALSVDIAVGAAASEKIIVADVVAQVKSASVFYFPLAIASGVRIAARAQSTASSDTATAAVITLDDAAGYDQTCSSVDCLGFTSGTSKGVTLDAGGVANTKSAYIQIVASTAADYSGFVLCLASPSPANTTVANMLVDVAVGGAGSEKVLLSNLYVRSVITGAITPSPFVFSASPVAAGSRIAARSQSASIAATPRTALCTIYGIRS